MRRVFYISRSAPSVTHAEVQRILQTSRRRNRGDDLTGCLLFSGQHFMQVLEGEPAALERTLARIAADPRHHDVRVIADQAALTRRYPDWSMGLLFKLAVADRIEALLGGADAAAAAELMDEVVPDTVAGAL